MTQTVVTTHPVAQRSARLIASLFGIGYIPWAPGTLASGVGVLTGALIMRGGLASLPEAVLAIAVLGLMSIEYTGFATNDPSWIVIDELAGMWVAMLTLSRVSAPGLLTAFLLFRLFDIAKPGPVGWADRKHNAAGIMADDLIAGVMAAALIWAIQWQWPHLL